MAFTCHPATLEEEFCNAKNWDLAEALQQTKIPRYAKVMANYCKVNCH